MLSYLQPLLADPLHNLRPYGLRPLIGWGSALQWIWLVPLVWGIGLVRARRWRTLVVQVGLPVAPISFAYSVLSQTGSHIKHILDVSQAAGQAAFV